MTTSLSRLQELLPQLFQTHQLPGDVYLRLQLTAEITALLSVEQVKESILANAEQITRKKYGSVVAPKRSVIYIGAETRHERF
jgi:hypothetical protein